MTAQASLDQASEVCLAIGAARNAHDDQLDSLLDRRRQLWHEAQEAGATYEDIAGKCNVAASLVIREIARYRKKPWAVKRYG